MNTGFVSLLNGRSRILAPLVGGSDLSFRLLCRKYDPSIVTYEEGLTKRKYYLGKIKEQWLTEFDYKKNIAELKKLYPDKTEEELKYALDKYKESRIEKLDDKMSPKSNKKHTTNKITYAVTRPLSGEEVCIELKPVSV